MGYTWVKNFKPIIDNIERNYIRSIKDVGKLGFLSTRGIYDRVLSHLLTSKFKLNLENLF